MLQRLHLGGFSQIPSEQRDSIPGSHNIVTFLCTREISSGTLKKQQIYCPPEESGPAPSEGIPSPRLAPVNAGGRRNILITIDMNTSTKYELDG